MIITSKAIFEHAYIMEAPFIIGIASLSLNDEERKILIDRRIHGVILFSRNYQDKTQLRSLCTQLHQLKTPALKIYVDQEGGQVQRFREGFSKLPALGHLGALYHDSRKKALVQTQSWGYKMADELLTIGIDQSFAPVVDLNRGSLVIGPRSFSDHPNIVIELANAYIDGMKSAGMPAILKHFPGHGSVTPDTHHNFAYDERSFTEIAANDLLPFKVLSQHENVGGLMVAHVVYPQLDSAPASLSHFWLHEVLRQQLKFKGKIFSDDLGMKAVSTLGTPVEVSQQALKAGSDYVLLCNDWQAVLQVLQDLS